MISDLDAYQRVVAYHEATKHFPHRYARSLGYLDWATQPDPFRRFEGSELIRLNLPTDDDTGRYEDLFDVHSRSVRPVTADTISQLLYLSLAISAWKQYGDTCWSLRCNPSSGNLHPTEGYLLLPDIAGVGVEPGLYHYAPREHGLERRRVIPVDRWRALTASVSDTSFFVGLSSVHWREAWKYGERAFRYCNHDVGHALAAMRIAAAELGWRLTVLEGLSDNDVETLLAIGSAKGSKDAEVEHPDLVAIVSPDEDAALEVSGVNPDAIASIGRLPSLGRANALSQDHVAWDIIDIVAEATRKPATEHKPQTQSKAVDVARSSVVYDSVGASTGKIVRQRRSAVAFDNRTSVSAGSFYHMMRRVMPTDNTVPPWDAITWPPAIHLFLFVHRIEGLPSGLYALVRDPDRSEALKEATHPSFAWSRPEDCPNELSLYLLQVADCRRAAAQLSLGQEIAGASAFSLGMIADFDATLRRWGAWFYRRLFWEAGMIGQVLYLEAEATGIRATGIGAYFDDAVHEVFGLSGHAFQSMYHFTVGGPVHDDRLTTWPAYPPRA